MLMRGRLQNESMQRIRWRMQIPIKQHALKINLAFKDKKWCFTDQEDVVNAWKQKSSSNGVQRESISSVYNFEATLQGNRHK